MDVLSDLMLKRNLCLVSLNSRIISKLYRQHPRKLIPVNLVVTEQLESDGVMSCA